MRIRLPRLSLLQTFGVVSLLVIAGLGATLGTLLHIAHRAPRPPGHPAPGRRRSPTSASPASCATASPTTGRCSSASGSPRSTAGSPRAACCAASSTTTAGTSSGPTTTSSSGEDASRHGDVREALAGEVDAHVEADAEELGAEGRFFEVYVPIRGGVFESYMSYEPTARAIASDTRTLLIALIGGLLLLWAGLFRIVARASRRLRHQATHDTLTGLSNRAELHEEGAKALANAGRDGSLAALMLIDLDRFKEVNDTMGHEQGDRLLVDVAERLRQLLRGDDILRPPRRRRVRRAGRTCPTAAPSARWPPACTAPWRLPFDVGGVAIELGASIGIALQPDHGEDVSTLLRHADVAMYEAKRSGSQIETYSTERDPYSAERLKLLGELRHALDHDELVLHFQPKVALSSGSVIGVEALVRWEHPERGLLGPHEFLGLAERTGLIGDITRWVLDAAVRQCAAWRRAGIELPVAVNLAAANIVDTTLPEAVAHILQRWEVPGRLLECEISEDTVMGDPRRAGDVLERLRELGVRLSLDDFGTGHSSLSYLKRLPLDEVKIDRSFVIGMADDPSDAAIVRSTIDLARHLGLEVVAEGVETTEVLDVLAALQCDVAQGFLLSRPLPAAEFDGWLAARA